MVIRIIIFVALLGVGLLLYLFRTQDHLTILYQTSIGTMLRPLLIRKWASSLAGYYANSSWSKRHIKPFIKKYVINMDESEKNIEEFTTFNDFFIRKLKPNARHINDIVSELLSPADSYLLVKENVQLHDTFPIKEQTFSLVTCLNDEKLAKQFKGCTLFMFRLAPWHYHRFHAPASGTVQTMKKIVGVYDSVNPLVYKNFQPLHHNERTLIELDTPNVGKILIMPVGALFVGSITATYTPDDQVQKGDELGYFSFGGSTVLVLTQKGRITVDKYLISQSALEIETEVICGQSLAKIMR